MARREPTSKSSARLQSGVKKQQARRQFEFLRYTHIFASVVREILEMKFLRETSPFSLSLSQFHLLKVIALNGDHQVSEMAGVLGVSPPAVTKNIDKLERLNLLVRTPSKGDRRATLLSPSAKGRRLVRKYENLKTDRLAPILKEFNPEELDQMALLLKRFSLSLIRQEVSDDGLCLRCAAYWEKYCPVGQIHGGCPYQDFRGTQTGEGAAEEAS